MLLTNRTVRNLVRDINQLASLNCYACCNGYPDWNWMHQFGCGGPVSLLIEIYLDDVLHERDLTEQFPDENSKEQLKNLLRIYWTLFA